MIRYICVKACSFFKKGFTKVIFLVMCLNNNLLNKYCKYGHKNMGFNKIWDERQETCRTASLMAQCLRICLPMQGTWVRALVRADPTCCGATKPVRHNYWACALEPVSHNYWAHVPQPLKPACLEPMLRNKRSHHNEKPAHHNEE